jgi:Na+-driven multidrug efflux pump
MQQVMYEQTPWVVLTYPKYLQAYNDADWTGWIRMFDGTGPAFLTTGYVQSYVDLKPVEAEASSGGSTLWIAAVAAAAVGALVIIWLVRRRRVQAEES